MDGQRSEAGFTLFEVTISMAILAVGCLALWGTLIYCTRSNLAAEQKKKAIDAAAARIEFLKSQPFDTIVADFSPGTSNLDRFAVPTLDAEEARAHGRVLLYTDETNPTAEAGLGLPRDLNGDGDATDVDVSGGYRLLPVKVMVSWEGALGPQRIELRTVLRREE